ncbi:hypothetical protein EV183_002782 [Coemansia sp. RSA 2336]|nr:hypothetical protein EV183_002782 [Coemansia sp. RSA 2336]
MNVATRSRAKEGNAETTPNSTETPSEAEATSIADQTEHSKAPSQQTTAPADDESISIPAQNIRHFKEQVVNTSRLLKVFSDQEKELAKAKAELAKHSDEAKRMHTAYQNLQREIDTRARELAKANAETENARSLLVLREEELSRVRGLKEDLEARIAELSQAAPVVEQATPPRSPNVMLVEEIERLKRELEAKEGSLKSLRISRDAIRSTTKAEIMSIQAKYAREQKEMIQRQEREMADHRASLAGKESELEQQQERLMQLETDLSMRETQMEDQVAEFKAKADDAAKSLLNAQQTIKKLEEQAKSRSSEQRAEINKLNRELKKSEKQNADLSAALKRAQEGAKSRESSRARSKQRPRSTATAAEAIQVATEDVAEMDIEELRNEVKTLRVDSVHQEETIRRYRVMLEEIERKQNPEGRRPRARAGVLEKEVEKLKTDVEERDRQIAVLKESLNLGSPETSEGPAEPTAPSLASKRLADLNLKVLSLEATIKEREQSISALESELKEAKETANDRHMRLRHSHTPTQAQTPGTTSWSAESTGVSGGRHSLRSASPADTSRCKDHYAEIASLRASSDKLKQEKAALQELVTEQQVKIRQLRTGEPMAPVTTPTPAQRKRPQQSAASGDSSLAPASAVLPKRPKYVASSPAIQKPAATSSKKAAASAASTKRAQPAASSATMDSSQAAGPEKALKEIMSNRRILSTTRAKRCFGLIASSPLELHSMLARSNDKVLPTDTARFAELLIAQINTDADSTGVFPSKVSLDTPDEKAVQSSQAAAKLRQLVPEIGLGLYKQEALLAMSVWTLVVKSEQATFYGDLMHRIAQELVKQISAPSAAVCSLARVFVTLCLLAADIQRVRVLLCDLLMDAVDSSHTLPVLANVLAVWPQVLQMPSAQDSDEAEPEMRQSFELMVRVFQAIAAGIHDLYKEERGAEEADALYAVMVERCGWRRPEDAEFADKLMVEVKNTLGSLDNTSRGYPVVMAAFNLLSPYMV